jgi:hypothetical protein
MEGYELQLAAVLGAGVLAGLALLVRGMRGYGTATRIGDTGTSRIATLAAGEVRVSGVIEAAEVTLVSPLQSAPCVYYRSTIDFSDDDVGRGDDLFEERAVGFRVIDETGDVRVFPLGARWDAPTVFDDQTGMFGEQPVGLSMRTGSAVGPAELDREAAIAALLTVRPADPGDSDTDGEWSLLGSGRLGSEAERRRRHYREARLAPGDTVTVVGRAMPFSDLADPTEADQAIGSGVAADDPEVAADLAKARAAGLLADDPAEAWGNAAIPGFGIGRPVRAPELDPDADALALGTAEDAARIERRFAIAPETLVLASARDVPLLIAHGIPGTAAERHEATFVVGLLGALLAIGSAMGLAILVSGGFGS